MNLFKYTYQFSKEQQYEAVTENIQFRILQMPFNNNLFLLYASFNYIITRISVLQLTPSPGLWLCWSFVGALLLDSQLSESTMVTKHIHGEFACRCIDPKLLLCVTTHYLNPYHLRRDWLQSK